MGIEVWGIDFLFNIVWDALVARRHEAKRSLRLGIRYSSCALNGNNHVRLGSRTLIGVIDVKTETVDSDIGRCNSRIARIQII